MAGYYRNEKVPEYSFVNKLKLVDENLYVVFDSISMRWHIFYKDVNSHNHLILRVEELDHEGRDIGYRPLDDRTINKLLRMDLSRRNMSANQYKNAVRNAEDETERKDINKYNTETDYAFKHDKRIIDRAYDALRGVDRKF